MAGEKSVDGVVDGITTSSRVKGIMRHGRRQRVGTVSLIKTDVLSTIIPKVPSPCQGAVGVSDVGICVVFYIRVVRETVPTMAKMGPTNVNMDEESLMGSVKNVTALIGDAKGGLSMTTGKATGILLDSVDTILDDSI